jgi:hypothetical protein
VSAAAAPGRALAGALGRSPSTAPAGTATALTRREAALRSAATACLAGTALVLGIELAPVLARSAVLGALLLAAMALCVGAGLALAAAPVSASQAVWRTVAGPATLVLAGWALPHAVALPEPAGARGDWTASPGVVAAGLAAGCLVLAAVAVPPKRTTARGLAAAVLVLVAWGPGAAAFLVATAPGPADGEAAVPTDVRAHVHAIAAEPVIVRRAGRNGDHFVTPVSTPGRAPAAGVGLLAAAAEGFAGGAAASLWRRSARPG